MGKMRKINLFTFELEAGMITAEDVFTIIGQLLVPENTILDNTIINKFRLYNISSVAIWEEEPEVEPEYTEGTFSHKIKSSEEFKIFKGEYLESIKNFQNAINDIVAKNAPVDPQLLLKKTASLLNGSSSSLHIFDMLHNMREFDDSTFTHCINVALICHVFGKWLNFSNDDIDTLTLAGLLHDIGKLTTPERILTKPGRLTSDEYRIMKNHVTEGYNYLKPQELDPCIKEAALFHHERCDGSGYPLGLTGNQIPDFAKIVSIADVYDAMTAKRVYRGPLCPFTVIKYIESEGYAKYDPKYLMTFLENVVSTYIGTTVRLTNGQVGEVIMINKQAISKPVVHCGDEFIDLSGQNELEIEAIV